MDQHVRIASMSNMTPSQPGFVACMSLKSRPLSSSPIIGPSSHAQLSSGFRQLGIPLAPILGCGLFNETVIDMICIRENASHFASFCDFCNFCNFFRPVLHNLAYFNTLKKDAKG